ncbi:MAG: recombination regulator RecX [Rhodoferax sp.]|nr:recombination regulator RecX [Rhodoferax sp.]
MPITVPSLKGRALRLLSTREHSRAELERKLAPYAPEPGQLAPILDDLQARGFICEERVAASVVNLRAAKFGASRIRQEMQAKGLARDLVDAAMAGLQQSELARAKRVWDKKFGGARALADGAHRAHQARFLASRGFGSDTIRRVLSGPGADEEDPSGEQ